MSRLVPGSPKTSVRSFVPNSSGLPGFIRTCRKWIATPSSSSTVGTRSNLPTDTPPAITVMSEVVSTRLKIVARVRRSSGTVPEVNGRTASAIRLGREHRTVGVPDLPGLQRLARFDQLIPG